MPISSEEFDEEPYEKVEYFLAFKRIEQEVEAEMIERMQAEAEARAARFRR